MTAAAINAGPASYVFIVLMLAALTVTEFLLAVQSSIYGLILTLFTPLLLYPLLSIRPPAVSAVGDLLDDLLLLYVYNLLVSALPWFLVSQELLIPAVYSMVLVLCFVRVYQKGVSLRDLGFVREHFCRDFALGSLIGIPAGFAEYLVLRVSTQGGSFNPWYLLQTAIVMYVFLAPGEELLFRGIIQRSMTRSMGAKWGLIGAAMVFAVMHLVWRSVFELVFVFFAGLLLGVIYWRTGRITMPIAIHASNNIILLTVAPYLLAVW